MRVALSIALILVLLLFAWWITPHVFPTTLVGTVTKTEIKRYSGEDIYLVRFQVDGEESVRTFKNVDAWLWFKFNSSDVQGNLQDNKRYRIEVVGRRWYWPTDYQNIIDFEASDGEKNQEASG